LASLPPTWIEETLDGATPALHYAGEVARKHGITHPHFLVVDAVRGRAAGLRVAPEALELCDRTKQRFVCEVHSVEVLHHLYVTAGGSEEVWQDMIAFGECSYAPVALITGSDKLGLARVIMVPTDAGVEA
jgi:hypothetical protein